MAKPIKYEEASVELILKVQVEGPGSDEKILSFICCSYETIMDGPSKNSQAKPLSQNVLKYLRQQLPHHPLAHKKLVDYVDALVRSPVINWNLSATVEAYLFLYKLDLNEEQEQRLSQILIILINQTELLNIPLQIRELNEIQSILEAAKQSLGDASFCLRCLLTKAITSSEVDKSAAYQMIRENFGENNPPVYFPKQLQNRLAKFRDTFQQTFEEQFPRIALGTVDSDKVRAFQTAIFQDFKVHVLDARWRFSALCHGTFRAY